MDFDITAINIQIHTYGLNEWNHPAICECLFAKAYSSSNFDLFQVYLNAAFGDKDGLLISEVVTVESALEV